LDIKNPHACHNIEEIRFEIDKIDKKIIELIGKRSGFVKAAAQFKTDESSVKAPDRVKSLLAKRREWAGQYSIDPDFIETLFSGIVKFFISKELKTWKNEQT